MDTSNTIGKTPSTLSNKCTNGFLGQHLNNTIFLYLCVSLTNKFLTLSSLSSQVTVEVTFAVSPNTKAADTEKHISYNYIYKLYTKSTIH